MSHTIASTEVTWHRVTITCECGHETRHPNPEGAHTLHRTHVGIQEARQALKEGTA